MLMGTLGKFQKESVFLQEKHAKRAEIEARLAEDLRREKEQLEERMAQVLHEKQRRAERLRRESLREFERMSLETYYRNEIAAAHALKTATLPVLFYQPWKLSPKEEEKAKIRVEELERRYQHALKKLDEALQREEVQVLSSLETERASQKKERVKTVDQEAAAAAAASSAAAAAGSTESSRKHAAAVDQDNGSFLTDPPSESIHDPKVSDHTEDMVEY
ncbi:hypothetical protein PORY_000817 [Pneumocystis oryctolagi]|uniref:Uncharacterized protein n=1 Tax=Pneumocystis oryctolagi TaxID=42067 RepID=A0ACB7CGU9_9ASCO|nr:hypothetical protein PORY_000817 [Pneumocystis oryctolagi]